MLVYKGHRFGNIQEFYDWILQHPEERAQAYASLPSAFKPIWDSLDQYYAFRSGQGSANDVLQSAGEAGIEIDPTLEKSLDNIISRENTTNAQQYEEHMRDTSLLSSGSQLQSLGLSPSVVAQVGGASSNGVAAASNNMRSSSNIKQQLKINDYNQKMGMARQVVGLVGNMASSGIYGHALGAVKHAASAVTGATAHSGLNLLKSYKSSGNMGDFYNEFPLPGEGGNNSPIG